MTVVHFAVAAFVASAARRLARLGGGSLLGRLMGGRRGRLSVAICCSTVLGSAVAVLLR